jgi:hypothetical protein
MVITERSIDRILMIKHPGRILDNQSAASNGSPLFWLALEMLTVR